jgi:hypothetical protein
MADLDLSMLPEWLSRRWLTDGEASRDSLSEHPVALGVSSIITLCGNFESFATYLLVWIRWIPRLYVT